MKLVHSGQKVSELQAEAVLSQANPVSGTKYTVLDTTINVRLYSATAAVTWTVQPTPLDIHLTIDGNSLTFSASNPVSATNYHLQRAPEKANGGYLVTSTSTSCIVGSHFIDGRSVKIEAETTGGTVQNLDARVKYGQW